MKLVKGSARDLRSQIFKLKRELRENQQLFDLQHTRDRQAVALWREKEGKPDTLPDLGALLEWLMDRGARWQAVLEAAREIAKNHGGHSKLEAALKRHDEFWGVRP